MKSLNIVFAGTPAFALPSLDAIAASKHQLQAIYTQPDRPAGRGRKLQASAVKDWAETHQIPIYQPTNFKQEEAVNAKRREWDAYHRSISQWELDNYIATY